MLKAKLSRRIDKKYWNWVHKGKIIFLISTLFYLVSCNEKLDSNKTQNRNQGNQQNKSSSLENDKQDISKDIDDKKVEITNLSFESRGFFWFKDYLKFTIENIGKVAITTEDEIRFSIEIRTETGVKKKKIITTTLNKIKSFKNKKSDVYKVGDPIIVPGGIEEFTLPVKFSKETSRNLKRRGALLLKLEILSNKNGKSTVIASSVVRFEDILEYNNYYFYGYFPGFFWGYLLGLWLFILII